MYPKYGPCIRFVLPKIQSVNDAEDLTIVQTTLERGEDFMVRCESIWLSCSNNKDWLRRFGNKLNAETIFLSDNIDIDKNTIHVKDPVWSSQGLHYKVKEILHLQIG